MQKLISAAIGLAAALVLLLVVAAIGTLTVAG